MQHHARTFTIAAARTRSRHVAHSARPDKGCTNTLNGTFAYTSTGYIVAAPVAAIAGPFAEIGTLIFDGKGGITASLIEPKRQHLPGP